MTLSVSIFSVVKANSLSKLLEVFSIFLVLFLRRECAASWGKNSLKEKNIDPFHSDLLQSIPLSQFFIYKFSCPPGQEE